MYEVVVLLQYPQRRWQVFVLVGVIIHKSVRGGNECGRVVYFVVDANRFCALVLSVANKKRFSIFTRRISLL